MAALPEGELESRSQAVLPGAAAESRCRAHFWALRSARPGGGRGQPQARSAVCARTHRNVRADCAESLAETDVSCDLGKAAARRSKRSGHHFGAGSRGTRRRRDCSLEGRIAAERCGSAGILARTRHVPESARDFTGRKAGPFFGPAVRQEKSGLAAEGLRGTFRALCGNTDKAGFRGT